MNTAVRVFYSYADSEQDRALFAELEKHLKVLQYDGRIVGWNKQEIGVGEEKLRETEAQFAQAQVILLLISPDFMASSYLYYGEMAQALERQEKGEAYVVPILLRPTYYKNAAFAHLAILPKDGHAITSRGKQIDEAFVEVAEELDQLLLKHFGVASQRAETGPAVQESISKKESQSNVSKYKIEVNNNGPVGTQMFGDHNTGTKY